MLCPVQGSSAHRQCYSITKALLHLFSHCFPSFPTPMASPSPAAFTLRQMALKRTMDVLLGENAEDEDGARRGQRNYG